MKGDTENIPILTLIVAPQGFWECETGLIRKKTGLIVKQLKTTRVYSCPLL